MNVRGVAHVPWYPALIALTFIFSRLVVTWAPLEMLGRPLILALPVIVAAQLALALVVGRHRAAFLVGLAVATVIDVRIAAMLAIVGAGAAGVRSFRRGGVAGPEWPKLTWFINGMAAATLGVWIAQALLTGGLPSSVRPSPVAAPATAGAEAPDIYLLLLDGYPRADTLRDAFGFDQSPFFEAMARNGFDVAEHAHSNYNKTMLTLASLFNARHVTELLPSPASSLRGQVLQLNRLINSGAALSEARQRGYQIVSFAFEAQYVTLTGADRVIDGGRLNLFDLSLMKTGVLLQAVPTIFDTYRADHRGRVVDTLEGLGSLAAEPHDQPRLVFAHVAAPHPPFVFNADGSERPDNECGFAICFWDVPVRGDRQAALRGQVTYINSLVLEATRAIAEGARPSVIVVFSDHGLRFDASDPDEMFRSLLLARTPDHPGLFPDDASPINMLPRLLNAYAGSNLQLQPETEYITDAPGWSDDFFPLEVRSASE